MSKLLQSPTEDSKKSKKQRFQLPQTINKTNLSIHTWEVSKRMKRSAQIEALNRVNNLDLQEPSTSRKRLASNSDIDEDHNQPPTKIYPIPLPFVDEINHTFEDESSDSESEPINIGAEDLFTEPTIPFSTSSDKPSTSSAFTFPNSIRTFANESFSSNSDSTDESESSDEEELVAEDPDRNKSQNKRMTALEFYRERLNQLRSAQEERRERWRKKLQHMQALLDIIKS